MADDIQYMTDAEIEATWGKGSAVKIREQDRLKRLATQETFVAENQPVPRRKGNRDRSQPPPPPESTEADFLPAPSNRSVGGVRGRYESPAEFRFRMNQGIPRGARGGGGGGLDEQMLLQTGMSAEDARLKANILRSQGGRVVRRDDGSLGSESASARRAPRSSTGRDYDPVAERKAMLANAKAAVDERKNLQASDAILLRKQEEAARTPGTMRGFATEKGFGQAKTNTLEEFLKRPAAKITEGRNRPVTGDMREVLGFMNNEQNAEDAAYAERVKTVGAPMNRSDAAYIRKLREQLNGSNVAPNTGMVGMDSLSNLRAGDERVKAYNQTKKNQVSNFGKAFAGRGMA